MISLGHLKAILHYEPKWGIFRWIVGGPGRGIGRICGNTGSYGYRRVMIDKKYYSIHRLAWYYCYGYFPKTIDHINGNRADNRIANLREATKQENAYNEKTIRKSKTGLRGIGKCRSKWFAQIRHNGKRHHLGSFNSPEEAHAAYLEADHLMRGSFSHSIHDPLPPLPSLELLPPIPDHLISRK